jgi:hypothetical protein
MEKNKEKEMRNTNIDGRAKKTIDNSEKHDYIDDIKKSAVNLSRSYTGPIQIQINVKNDINQVKISITEVNI